MDTVTCVGRDFCVTSAYPWGILGYDLFSFLSLIYFAFLFYDKNRYGNTSGTISASLPRTPGEYQARLFAAGAKYNEQATMEFDVIDSDQISAVCPLFSPFLLPYAHPSFSHLLMARSRPTGCLGPSNLQIRTGSDFSPRARPIRTSTSPPCTRQALLLVPLIFPSPRTQLQVPPYPFYFIIFLYFIYLASTSGAFAGCVL